MPILALPSIELVRSSVIVVGIRRTETGRVDFALACSTIFRTRNWSPKSERKFFFVCQKCGKVDIGYRETFLGSRTIDALHQERNRQRQAALGRLHDNEKKRCRCRERDSVSLSPRPVRKTSTSSLAKELLELKNLFDQGILTREQFERAKNKLLE